MSETRDGLFLRIEAERLRQDNKWGGRPGIDRTDTNYPAILGEEFGEVCKDVLEGKPAEAVTELVQVAAVAVAWAEQIIESGVLQVPEEFSVKDSGERKQFESGMVRDTSEGKVNFLLVRPGPMLRRWASHLSKAESKYPPVAVGVPNWTLAAGEAELERFRESAARHFESWINGERDEDHAAGVFFNINGAEYVRDRLAEDPIATEEDFVAAGFGPSHVPEFGLREWTRGK